MLKAIIHSENKIFMKDLQQIIEYLLSCSRNYKERFQENRNTYRIADISALLLAQDKNKLLYKKLFDNWLYNLYIEKSIPQ